MLDDSHKRLRNIQAPSIPQPISISAPLKKSTSTGEHLSHARDKTSIYATTLSDQMSEEERSQLRKELKERFSPGARPMPTTLQGLTSLANERIEDAISRGQFKSIPRGKGKNVEKDHNASSPFLDTTEYFMNRMIQRQGIVPPWIEKQQELVKRVGSFRARLRSDWRRHAARMIASHGGSLESQIRRAEAYALAEERVNPLPTKAERSSKIDSQGNLSTITEQETSPRASETPTGSAAEPPKGNLSAKSTEAIITTIDNENTRTPLLPTSPFRDPNWERTESKYHNLVVTTLNSLTRSYNLQAPTLAQRPYYDLKRELLRCYADTAPLLPAEIHQRARTPSDGDDAVIGLGITRGGITSTTTTTTKTRNHPTIREEDHRKRYGFREFWRDLFR